MYCWIWRVLDFLSLKIFYASSVNKIAIIMNIYLIVKWPPSSKSLLFLLSSPTKQGSCDVFATSLFRSQVARPLTHSLLLSCPQIATACIMTSQLPCFVGELSKKKQTLTTVGLNQNFYSSVNCSTFHFALISLGVGQYAENRTPKSSYKAPKLYFSNPEIKKCHVKKGPIL